MNRIYYFSGTGNALAIARELGEKLGDTEIVNLASSPDPNALDSVDRIGFVFPVFGWGLPRIVRQFAQAIRPRTGQYTFAVATSAGSPATTLRQLRRLLRAREADLHAGFTVHGDFQISSQDEKPMAIIRLMIWLVRNHQPDRFSQRIEEIASTIQNKERHVPETSNVPANALGSLINGFASRSFQTADRSFGVRDACVSCGICARVCPRENVRLEAGTPSWHGNCEFCYACMAWCPEGAITLNGNPPIQPAHHPDVALEDVLLR